MPDPKPPPGDGPILSGAGPAWPPSPGEYAHMRPGLPWNHRPPPGSDADSDQAVAAKIHIGMRVMPILAEADLVLVDPARVASIPAWRPDGEEEAAYAAVAKLSRSPVFLDFEALDGRPFAWRQETWPFPFYLRGALCWSEEDLLSIVPFGSVGSRHPWGAPTTRPGPAASTSRTPPLSGPSSVRVTSTPAPAARSGPGSTVRPNRSAPSRERSPSTSADARFRP